jgi:hypothetical protein
MFDLSNVILWSYPSFEVPLDAADTPVRTWRDE